MFNLNNITKKDDNKDSPYRNLLLVLLDLVKLTIY